MFSYMPSGIVNEFIVVPSIEIEICCNCSFYLLLSIGGGPAIAAPEDEAYSICETVGREKIVGFGDDLETGVTNG